jgi:hypothetical protein
MGRFEPPLEPNGIFHPPILGLEYGYFREKINSCL